MITLNSVDLKNGETIGFRKIGDGDKVLVFLHGNMSSSKHWDTVMENMPEEFTSYAIDMRGFGDSSYNSRFDSLKELSEDLKLFVDEIGLTKFSLAGWSTGGGVALHFTLDYPDYVEKLILVESVGPNGYPIFRKDDKGKPILGDFLTTKEEIEEDPVQVLPILNAYKEKNRDFLRWVWNATIYDLKQPDQARYEEYIDEMLTQRNLVDIDYSLVHFNVADRLASIKTPSLVIQGKYDLVVPMSMADELVKGIGEAASLHLHEGGHSPITDDLDGFMKTILDFIKG